MYEYATTTGASTLSLHDALPIFEQFRIGESKELKHPECVRCPPVVLVTVKNHRGVFVDAFFTEKLLKLLRGHIIADDWIVQILVPIDLLCAGNMAGVVKENVFIALDDSDARIVEMRSEPVRADENFRVHVPLAGDGWIGGRCVGCDRRPHC